MLHINSLLEIAGYFSDSEWSEFHSLYEIIDVIGSGGFAVCLKARDVKNRRNVALKVVVKEDGHGAMLQKEFEYL